MRVQGHDFKESLNDFLVKPAKAAAQRVSAGSIPNAKESFTLFPDRIGLL